MQNIVEFEPARAGKLNWDTILIVAGFHLLAIPALFTFSWQNFTAAFILWWVGSSWGIGLGFHRLLTHRGFYSPQWLTRTLATFGTLALQSGPITWVTTHRIHHAFTDQERDPHSPVDKGFFWAHMGWIFEGTAQNQSEGSRRRYSPDLLKDPYLVWLDKYYYVPTLIVTGILFAIGGLSMVFWGMGLRMIINWHFTWMVNSVTHVWGSRRFDTRDDSRNNGLIAAITFGEGWHNNHHAIPRSARHGLTWKEFDINWVQLRVLEKLGIIRDVYAYDLNAEGSAEPELRRAA